MEHGESKDSAIGKEIPEPAETKELDVPEIEKGPLFIRRSKFDSAKQMIQEMHYLVQEIQNTVEGIERGIEEDREIEENAKQVLHQLGQNRKEVEHIIHPDAEN